VHEELRRHAVELLARLLADAFEDLAAGAVRLVELVAMLDARQLLGQGLAHRAAASSSRVSTAIRSNSTACVPLARLSLLLPKRQRLSRAISKFSASMRVLLNCSSACSCVFRPIVTDRFGIVTAEFGNVTGDFGDVTDGPPVPA